MVTHGSFLGLALCFTAVAGHAQQVPALQGTALSGDKVNFPEVFRGHSSVLIVSFSQAAKDNVTAWYRRINTDFKNSPTVLYYEVPVIAGAPGFLRGTIVRKIKEDVALPAQPHFVPVLEHEDDWKSAAGWSRKTPDDHAFVLLVDGAGQIRSRADYAAPSDEAYANLKRKLMEVSH